ncbi:unnamed protein product [Amaranthus hypochondriacus]
MEKRPTLFWTPCAAHCIDLMLEDMDKHISIHTSTIRKVRQITTYIYSRTLLLTWMREFTKGRELIRPAITRFATSYLTLRCLNEHKGSLLALFASSKWKSSKFASSVEGKRVQRIVLDTRGFWQGVVTCLKGALLLVKVLCMVDSDENPAMGFIYEVMAQAKNQIKENFNGVEKNNYKPIFDIVDERWADQLHRPLHAAAYYLNPQFQYSPTFQASADIKIGLYNCLQRMVPDADERLKIDLQMDAFKNARGLFGLSTAIMIRTKKNPADWWDSYGDECPELKRFVVRILSLTCSYSGCERNWSAFEMLKRRQEKRQSTSNAQSSINLECLPSDDERIAEIEDPVLPSDNRLLNDLDRDARRFTRSALQTGVGENTDGDGDFIDIENELRENVDAQLISDDDEARTFGGSSDVDEDDLGDDGSFGYDE